MTDLSVLLFFALAVVYVIVKLLNLGELPRPPKLQYNSRDSYVNKILKLCPIFYERYSPPLLWGRNGHLQTFVFAKISSSVDYKATSRHSVKLADNSTVIFDIFEPNTTGDGRQIFNDYTVVMVPGIGNGSDAAYATSLSKDATRLGFRMVVLNHLGVLPVSLTSKRIFTYGSTCEFGAMVDFVRNNYPDTQLIGVGFSLGGNIMTKYLGENSDHQKGFVSAVSLCQGYDIVTSWPVLEQWDGFRRAYNWIITKRVKQIIKMHSKELLCGVSNQQLDNIFVASSLQEVDERYMRRMAGYPTLMEYYEDSSCSRYIDNITIPMLLLNAEDDPLIPDKLLDVPKKFVNRPDSKSVFLLTQFGGHLGFYEGSWVKRENETWLNKAILQYLTAVVDINGETTQKNKL